MKLLDVQSVSKAFKKFDSEFQRVLEMVSLGSITTHEKNWVLRDVSLDVARGESVAIVGENGAGKSTLLSMIVGAREPSSGAIERNCRISALLELGMGFHPELTGRANAITGLQLLGIPQERIPELVEEIYNFSELNDYFDVPLRTYSSGMQVRLGFSVATAVEPELLIVDEALAVGDAYFQHKSMSRIRELIASGTALLFVSHDPAAVRSLCDRAVLLVDGYVEKEGDPESVLNYYNALIAQKETDNEVGQIESSNRGTRSGNRFMEFQEVYLSVDGEKREYVSVGETVSLNIEFLPRVSLSSPTIGFSIRDRLGNVVFGTNTYHLNQNVDLNSHAARFVFPINLGPGSYSITVAAHEGQSHVTESYDWWDNALVFQILPGNEPLFEGTSFLPTQLKS